MNQALNQALQASGAIMSHKHSHWDTQSVQKALASPIALAAKAPWLGGTSQAGGIARKHNCRGRAGVWAVTINEHVAV